MEDLLLPFSFSHSLLLLLLFLSLTFNLYGLDFLLFYEHFDSSEFSSPFYEFSE